MVDYFKKRKTPTNVPKKWSSEDATESECIVKAERNEHHHHPKHHPRHHKYKK